MWYNCNKKEGDSMGRTSTAAKQRYNAKAYERVYLTIKKGKKALIERRAELLGLSVNAYLVGLIDRDTAGLDLSAPAADQDGGE